MARVKQNSVAPSYIQSVAQIAQYLWISPSIILRIKEELADLCEYMAKVKERPHAYYPLQPFLDFLLTDKPRVLCVDIHFKKKFDKMSAFLFHTNEVREHAKQILRELNAFRATVPHFLFWMGEVPIPLHFKQQLTHFNEVDMNALLFEPVPMHSIEGFLNSQIHLNRLVNTYIQIFEIVAMLRYKMKAVYFPATLVGLHIKINLGPVCLQYPDNVEIVTRDVVVLCDAYNIVKHTPPADVSHNILLNTEKNVWHPNLRNPASLFYQWPELYMLNLLNKPHFAKRNQTAHLNMQVLEVLRTIPQNQANAGIAPATLLNAYLEHLITNKRMANIRYWPTPFTKQLPISGKRKAPNQLSMTDDEFLRSACSIFDEDVDCETLEEPNKKQRIDSKVLQRIQTDLASLAHANVLSDMCQLVPNFEPTKAGMQSLTTFRSFLESDFDSQLFLNIFAQVVNALYFLNKHIHYSLLDLKCDDIFLRPVPDYQSMRIDYTRYTKMTVDTTVVALIGNITEDRMKFQGNTALEPLLKDIMEILSKQEQRVELYQCFRGALKKRTLNYPDYLIVGLRRCLFPYDSLPDSQNYVHVQGNLAHTTAYQWVSPYN
jgi:hypothetical protein